jgi:hypothetical protein
MLESAALDEALWTLGTVLQTRGNSYALVVVGGSSLLLLGLIDRPTRDLDVLGLVLPDRYMKLDVLPEPLAQAVADVGDALGLAHDWLNIGPASLLDFGLPAGFRDRVTVRRFSALELHISSRLDQVCFKLYAAVDHGPRSRHFDDLTSLAPSSEDLLFAARWTVTHDPSRGFRQELRAALQRFGVAVDEDDL